MDKPLTAVAVKKLPLPQQGERQRIVWDADAPGMGLLLNHASRSYMVQGRDPSGKSVRRTIGPASGNGAISLADARKQARALRTAIEQGKAPVTKRKVTPVTVVVPGIPTFRSVRDDYLADLQSRNMKSLVGVTHALKRTELAPLLDRPLAEITRDDIEAAFHRVLKTVKERAAARLQGRTQRPGELKLGRGTVANRLLSHLSSLLRWAAERRSGADPQAQRAQPSEGLDYSPPA